MTAFGKHATGMTVTEAVRLYCRLIQEHFEIVNLFLYTPFGKASDFITTTPCSYGGLDRYRLRHRVSLLVACASRAELFMWLIPPSNPQRTMSQSTTSAPLAGLVDVVRKDKIRSKKTMKQLPICGRPSKPVTGSPRRYNGTFDARILPLQAILSQIWNDIRTPFHAGKLYRSRLRLCIKARRTRSGNHAQASVLSHHA